MVSFEPSAGDALAHPLEELAKGIGAYLKPNHDFQLGMQKAISTNPQLLQSLADLEKNAPGSLSTLGFGSLGDIISRVPESAQSQFARLNKPEIVGNETQKLHLEGAQTGFESDKLAATKKYLQDNPSAVNNMIHFGLFKQTIDQAKGVELENRIKQAEAPNIEAEAKLREAKLPGEIAKAKAENDLQTEIDAHPELKKYDVMRVARDMIAGKTPPNLQLFMSTPQGARSLDLAVKINEMQLQRDQQALLRAQMHQGVDATERQNILQAGNLLKTTRAGTLASARTVLEHPEEVALIQEKLKTGGLTSLSQSEKDVIHSEDAKQELVNRQEAKSKGEENFRLIQADRSLRVSIKNKESPAEIDKQLSLTNSLLEPKGYQIQYGKIPEIGKTGEQVKGKALGFIPFTGPDEGLYYVDKTGARVDNGEPFGLRPQGLSKEGADFIMRYRDPSGSPEQKREALDLLKKKLPKVYNEIKDRIPK